VRALIVDDEPLARGELAYALRRADRDLEVTEVESAFDALTQLHNGPFDVMFLDLQMPSLGGLEAMAILNQLPSSPIIVIVTAYEQHALAGFELGATDYLLKPVRANRLALTLGRIRARTGGAPAAKAKVENSRFPVEGPAGTLLVRTAEIRFARAEGHTVFIHLFDSTFRYRGSLGECAERLQRHGFFQVHRSYLINPDHIREINPYFGGTYMLRVNDKTGSEVAVSRKYTKVVRDVFEL
jgi:two-component system, LytTR family, response regulator LytT